MSHVTMTELEKSGSVPSVDTLEHEQTTAPATGVKCYVDMFEGEAPFTTNSACKLMFGTEVVWAIKGSGKKTRTSKMRTGDGSKKWKIILDNSDDVAILMSAAALIREVS